MVEYRGGAKHRLANGIDISRMTVDQINAEKRKISPRFPTVADAQERLHKRREALVARTFGLMVLASPLVWGTVDGMSAVLVGGIGALGFTLTCFYAGNREYNRMTQG